MAGEFPRTVEEVSREWLSEALGGRVTGFEVTQLEGGVLADTYRLHSIMYEAESADSPPSVVVKMAHQNPEQRALALMNNAYLRELRFFEDLAPEVPLRTPRLYASASDGSPQAEFFILVMEDLSSHSKVFDQVDDTPSADFALKMALELAEFHARYWESPEVALPWLGQPDGRYQFVLDAVIRLAPTGWETIRSEWKRLYGRELFAHPAEDALEELTALLCGPQCEAILDRISDILSSRPHTVLHGDLRVDNIFRTDPALGKSVEESSLTYIDWQLMHAGPPGPDFATGWMGSLEPEVRRHDLEMLRSYYARLVELQPAAAAYTYEMLVEDYVLSCCMYWAVGIGVGPTLMSMLDQPGAERSRKFFEKGVVRMKAALQELGCLERIQAICAELPEGGPVAG